MNKRTLFILSFFFASAPFSLFSAQITVLEGELISLLDKTLPTVVTVQCNHLSDTLQQRSIGSGVVIREDGYLLTSSEIIGNAKQALAMFTDELWRRARVVGHDDLTGVCLLKIDQKCVAPVLGNSNKLKAGSWLLSVGTPNGLSFTPTTGFVSNPNRNIGMQQLIQISMTVRPGDSGAPVFNKSGELVGIVVAGLEDGVTEAISTSPTIAKNYDVGFISPINDLRIKLDQFIETGSIERGWLGVSILELTPGVTERFHLNPDLGGVMVVQSSGPAQEAGILPKDLIVAYSGVKIRNIREFRQFILSQQPNTPIELTLIRNNQEKVLTIDLGRLPRRKYWK
ncbi:MAG: hypothetical protein B6244_08815 [Candidatus Cloacimonetes bacterium 4572_55]|nr:MAG: hypothetical protein B6244_08815 [Candidatus Cloacimonetes bacterium 4572_55]